MVEDNNAALALLINIAEKSGGIVFNVRVVPRASKSEIIGEHDGAVKVRIASPPVDGAANAELIKLLSKRLGVSKGNVEIIGGQTSKIKQIRISGLTAAQFEAVLKAKTQRDIFSVSTSQKHER